MYSTPGHGTYWYVLIASSTHYPVLSKQSQNMSIGPPQQTVNTVLAVHSGHIPFQDGAQEVGTFNLVVSSTDPMFLYCATGPHCQEGQVMVVNP